MSATRPPSYDDRFVVPLEPSRRGAHRARMSPVIAVLPVIAVIAVVVAVVALAWTLFGGSLLGGGGANTQAASVTTLPSSTASASASASTQPSTSASATTSQPAAVVDRTLAVTVLNSTRTSGLAKGAVTRLQGKGWTKAQVSYTAATARPTTIYYSTTAQKDTATALRDDLGGGTVKKSAAIAGGALSVVLGTDYVG